MVCQFDIKELKQKMLYYKIQNTFNIENSNTHTYAGIYVIIKNDYPVYVGQSKNLASRIATHLKGKYAEADMILAFDVRELGWADFHSKNTTSKQEILNNAEKYIIKVLKPTENIIVDFDFELNESCKPNFCKEDFEVDFFIAISDDNITIGTDIFTVIIEDGYAEVDFRGGHNLLKLIEGKMALTTVKKIQDDGDNK
jgi:predicted GIY-YIG superfamily endonuclease